MESDAMPSDTFDGSARRRLDYAMVKQMAGSLAPWKVSAILALGATVGELEQALAWMSVESGGSGLHHAADADLARDSRVSSIFEILAADRPEPED